MDWSSVVEPSSSVCQALGLIPNAENKGAKQQPQQQKLTWHGGTYGFQVGAGLKGFLTPLSPMTKKFFVMLQGSNFL